MTYTGLSTPQIRKKLMRLDPRCHWCKRPLKMYQGFQTTKEQNRLPPDFPTIDHLYSLIIATKEQRIERNKIKNLVLACSQCNQARATAEAKKYRIKMYFMSASFPPPFRFVGHTLKAIRAYKKSVREAAEYDKIRRRRGGELVDTTGS